MALTSLMLSKKVKLLCLAGQRNSKKENRRDQSSDEDTAPAAAKKARDDSIRGGRRCDGKVVHQSNEVAEAQTKERKERYRGKGSNFSWIRRR